MSTLCLVTLVPDIETRCIPCCTLELIIYHPQVQQVVSHDRDGFIEPSNTLQEADEVENQAVA